MTSQSLLLLAVNRLSYRKHRFSKFAANCHEEIVNLAVVNLDITNSHVPSLDYIEYIKYYKFKKRYFWEDVMASKTN